MQKIADEFIVVPIAEESDRLNGVIKLNFSGAELWKRLEEKDTTRIELINTLVDQFQIKNEDAIRDVDGFLKALHEIGCLE